MTRDLKSTKRFFPVILFAALFGCAGGGAEGEKTPWWERVIPGAPEETVRQDPPEALPASVAAQDLSDYRLDTGDQVSVNVYGEPDLSVKGARVKGDGTVAFPLIGSLAVRNLTSGEIKELVARRLADGYLKNPNVTVNIDSYRLYYIKGEVKRPGGYSYVEGLTVQKAVALAGGLTERASERKITLVRDQAPEQSVGSVRPNTSVFPGDVITIGESFF